MNTADGRDKQATGDDVDSFAKPLLRTTSWGGHRPGAFERVLYQVYEALRPLIAARLSEEHAHLFAQPVTDPSTGHVYWYAPFVGEAVAYAELAPEDQAAVDTRVGRLLFDLQDLARRMQAQTKSLEEYAAGELLQIQIDAAYTEREYLYVVGFQPVVAFWAFESGYAPDRFVPSPKVVPPSIQTPPSIVDPEPAPDAETTDSPSLVVREPVAPKPLEATPTRPRAEPWSSRSFGVLAAVLAVAYFAIFGFSPRATVIDWLDRVQTLRAREQALLRIIARSERARTEGVSEAELEAELAAAAVPALPEAPPEPEEADEGFYAPAEKPMAPFDSAKGALTMEKLPGAVVILHFWSATGEKDCAEITSFVSMVGAESFESLREQGAEAYLVTTEESVEKGNELLLACAVQDPMLLRDPEGQVLGRLSPGAKPPATLVYDKEDERTLATYSRRNWADAKAFEELHQLFLMRVF